jgi:NDP-sugar pyrophosphorylase family protein
MPSLFETLKSNGKRIIAYPMHEPWLDIGRPDDLDVANQIITTSA